MLFSDLIEETKFSLSANKSRSALTILGIVIGIGSVIAMVSVGQGATSQITSSIETLGTNLLVVMPGSSRAGVVRGGMGSASTLTMADVESIRSGVNNVQAVAPVVSSRKQVTAKGTNTNTSITGIDADYFTIKNVVIDSGSAITASQLNAKSKVAILGPTTRDDLFGIGATNVIGQKIRIGSQEFTIIGVTQTKGGTGMGSSDDIIYVPITTAQQYITGNQTVTNINIQVSSDKLMATVQTDVTSLLLTRHKIADPAGADFSIMNQADMLSAMSSVTGTLTWLLGAIAGISLVVGGIGIMNMMLTSVTERTREIGLRKSLGAKKADISSQFIAESIALTFIGGIIGVIIGWLASYLVSYFAGMTTVVSYYSVLLAVGISAMIGIVFGYYPAQRAAKLDPIEALRYQ